MTGAPKNGATGWREMRVDQIGEIIAGATPSTSRVEYWDGPIVWVTPADLSTLNSRHFTSSERTLTELGLSHCAARLIPARNLVISARGSVGHMALPVVSFCTNQSCFTLEFYDGQNPDFHYYNLQFWNRRIEDKCEGTTFGSISGTALASVEVPVPRDTKVQAKIADVLATVDRAIEQTEALLAKQQRIKAGLMHNLLTRGLDAQGRLRDPTTHHFKPSPLGPIPKEWSLSRCGAEFAIDAGITLGPLRVPRYSPHGYLRVANVQRDRIVLDDVASMEVFGDEAEQKCLRTFDLLIVEGHANKADIGRCAMVYQNAEGLVFQNHLFRLRALSMRPEFALLWMNSTCARHYWDLNCSTSSGLNTINRPLLRGLPICVPSTDEQARVIDAATAEGRAIERSNSTLAKLRRLKIGLMQDLLTGRVPVTPLLAERQPAHAAA